MTTIDPQEFTQLRADWKAAGRPADHPYLALDLTPAPAQPLVPGITPGMVAAAAALRPTFVERPHWPQG